ncbi:RMD1 family protein [Candidatus Formimonas warabiya]|uniref:DUF155 domain-containing protein n=1 Tax=Formimonas warabiya TaxID=1761012 RepID=A0A3G1L1Z5_FORW1|nr:RMD1 family protein [Candidatus Formimonas warabiya]ATW28649.1 hypothetical protein DCMF_15830 [Candidatus Formimonas warabiya]
MQIAEFKALALDNEINLNKMAAHFGIEKKFKWEDPLILGNNYLKGILQVPEQKTVLVFSFGSLVCINCQDHEITDILKYLHKIDASLNIQSPFTYSDDYKMEINPESQTVFNFDYIVSPEFKNYHQEILAIVLAKSVALDRIEDAINGLLDEIESKIDRLEKGRLNISDRSLALISSQVLRFKYNTISYLMLLDKPEITWLNEESQEFFTDMSKLFELDDRYESIHHKTEILMDITQVLSDLTHAERGTRLEWMIIILIAFEILLSLAEKLI